MDVVAAAEEPNLFCLFTTIFITPTLSLASRNLYYASMSYGPLSRAAINIRTF